MNYRSVSNKLIKNRNSDEMNYMYTYMLYLSLLSMQAGRQEVYRAKRKTENIVLNDKAHHGRW